MPDSQYTTSSDSQNSVGHSESNTTQPGGAIHIPKEVGQKMDPKWMFIAILFLAGAVFAGLGENFQSTLEIFK